MFYIATQGSFRLGVTPEPPSPVPPQSRPWSLYCLAQWLHAELWSLRHTELSSHVPFQLESLATINWGRFAKPQVVDFGSLNLLFGSLLPNSRGGTRNWVTVESFSFCARSFHEGENTASPVEDKSKYGALVCKHAKRWISSGNQASVTDWWEINQSPTPQGLAWENLTKSELRAVSFRQIQQAGSTVVARFIVYRNLLSFVFFSFSKRKSIQMLTIRKKRVWFSKTSLRAPQSLFYFVAVWISQPSRIGYKTPDLCKNRLLDRTCLLT